MEKNPEHKVSKSRVGHWVNALASLDESGWRLLSRAAGVVGILAILNYLPYLDPYLYPPYPALYTGTYSVFSFVPHPVWTWICFLSAGWAAWQLLRLRYQRVAPLVLLLWMSGIITAARPLTSSSSSVFCLLMIFLILMPTESHNIRKGWAVAGMRIQLVLIYLCGVLFKMADPAWQLGYPLTGVFQGHNWSSGLGAWIGEVFPVWVMNLGGQLVSGLELLAPIGLVIGLMIPLLRKVCLGLLLLLHFGMALCMSLEIFPWVMMAFLLVYADRSWERYLTQFWDKMKVFGSRLREPMTAVFVGLIVLLASTQAFLPSFGIEIFGPEKFISPAKEHIRFDQHWGMFTHTSFDLDKEPRADSEKNYYTYRLMLRLEDDSLWDPFLGRSTSVKHALENGPEHPDSFRKALSYSMKKKGLWQERSLKVLARWVLQQARGAGQPISEVVIYRYHLPLNFGEDKSEGDSSSSVAARLRFRILVQDLRLGEMDIISPRSVKAVRFKLGTR